LPAKEPRGTAKQSRQINKHWKIPHLSKNKSKTNQKPLGYTFPIQQAFFLATKTAAETWLEIPKLLICLSCPAKVYLGDFPGSTPQMNLFM